MHSKLSKILVTGGAGFIGSAFVRLLLKMDCPSYPKPKKKVIVVDKLTYAGDLERLKEVEGRYKFYKADISNKRLMETIFKKENPEIVMNFAAQTHVDKSIIDSTEFIETNIKGTQVLLDTSRKYSIKQFIQFSSDESYGEIIKGRFSEDSPLRPNNPYAVTKAAADFLIRAYIRTYNFPAIIIRPCNNYGPWQYPEKLISLTILKILRDQKIPVYADGNNVREWLYVEDCAVGIWQILKKGKLGEIYNLGSNEERQNIEVVKAILKILNANQNLIQFAKDRPGHDIRYSLNSAKVSNEIGWHPKVSFRDGLNLTVQWYLEHKDWLLAKSKTGSLKRNTKCSGQ